MAKSIAEAFKKALETSEESPLSGRVKKLITKNKPKRKNGKDFSRKKIRNL